MAVHQGFLAGVGTACGPGGETALQCRRFYAFWKECAQLMKQHGGGLFLALFLLLLSGISLLLNVIMRRFYHKGIVLEYLAWGTFLMSLWLVAGSHLRQFLFSNISVASGLSFLAAMLALFPLLIYMDSVQKQRYQKG